MAIVEGVLRCKNARSLAAGQAPNRGVLAYERLDKLRSAAFSQNATDGQMLRYMATVLRELETDPAVSTKESQVSVGVPHSHAAESSAAPRAQVRLVNAMEAETHV